MEQATNIPTGTQSRLSFQVETVQTQGYRAFLRGGLGIPRSNQARHRNVISVPFKAMAFGEISGKGAAKSLRSCHVSD